MRVVACMIACQHASGATTLPLSRHAAALPRAVRRSRTDGAAATTVSGARRGELQHVRSQDVALDPEIGLGGSRVNNDGKRNAGREERTAWVGGKPHVLR